MSNAIAIAPERRSVLMDMAGKYGMEPAAFEATVRATCIKPDKNGRVASREEFGAFLLVAKQYDLNPLTKQIYAFTDPRGGVIPIVGVDGWSFLINSHAQFDGMAFEDDVDGNELVSITCKMFRKDRGHPIEITEYMAECKRDTDTWRKWPRRMLRHKAMIQTARYAFSLTGIYDPDEAARIIEARSQPYEATAPQSSAPGRRTPPAPPPAPMAAIASPAPHTPPAPLQAQQEAFDFDAFAEAFRAELKAVGHTLDESNEVYTRMVTPERRMTGEQIDEIDGILREHTAPMWTGDGP